MPGKNLSEKDISDLLDEAQDFWDETQIKSYVDAYLEKNDLSRPKPPENFFSFVYNGISPIWNILPKWFKRIIGYIVFIFAASFFLVETWGAVYKIFNPIYEYVIKLFQNSC